MDRTKDGPGLALLLGGVALAAVTAIFLPVLQFRGPDQTPLGLSAWQAVPVITMLKLALLAAAVAAAFLPQLQPMRASIIAAAIFLMFVPAIAALTAGVYHGSSLHEAIVALSGSRTPWVDPGWGLVALLVAVLMLVGALRRALQAERTGA